MDEGPDLLAEDHNKVMVRWTIYDDSMTMYGGGGGRYQQYHRHRSTGRIRRTGVAV